MVTTPHPPAGRDIQGGAQALFRDGPFRLTADGLIYGPGPEWRGHAALGALSVFDGGGVTSCTWL